LFNPSPEVDYVSLSIENFAKNLVLTLATTEPSDKIDQMDQETLDKEGKSLDTETNLPEDEIKRRVLLYFSLCTRKHELLLGLANIRLHTYSCIGLLKFTSKQHQ
jgi:hypothetical protein